MEHTKAQVREFLSQFFRNHILTDDEDIFSLGFVNSLFAMQLVLFIETELQVVIENEDLDFDNFRTINAIATLVERKNAVLA
jgi:methoxymalonate biosynthesis acyl carrier protein